MERQQIFHINYTASCISLRLCIFSKHNTIQYMVKLKISSIFFSSREGESACIKEMSIHGGSYLNLD